MSEKKCLQKWKDSFTALWGSRLYRAVLSLTALCSYGFLVTHHTVGIDDTPFALYFEEGLNAIVGRWSLFLLNKIFHVAEFVPFIVDLMGVLILMAAVTVWGALLYSICGDRAPRWGYLFFSCIFLSCPLLAEVYPYYLHNGVSVGYLCTGISLCFFRELSECEGGRRKSLARAAGMALFLFAALGCYESFMIVWLSGVFLVLLTEKYMNMPCRVCRLLGIALLSAAAAIILRSVMIGSVIRIFGLGYLREAAVQRSVGEILGWLFESGAAAEFAMAVKRFYVMYFVFGYAYYPVRIFVIASFFIGIYGLYSALKRKNPWIFILTAGCFVSCFLLVPVEGKTTLYRAAQFLPVICGYGAFLAAFAVGRLGQEHSWLRTAVCQETEKSGREKEKAIGQKKGGALSESKQTVASGKDRFSGRSGKIVTAVLIFLLSTVLWNQCFEMNKWFYVDWLKYESAVSLAEQIDMELKKNFDGSKPVVFIGNYTPPKSIIGDAYVEYGTETFFKMKRLTDPIDEHLLEKFYREYGVWVAQTPALSVYEWGVNAFGTDEELARFFAMHGLSVTANTNPEYFDEASGYFLNMPSFPEEGSIEDRGEYIIVRLQ